MSPLSKTVRVLLVCLFIFANLYRVESFSFTARPPQNVRQQACVPSKRSTACFSSPQDNRDDRSSPEPTTQSSPSTNNSTTFLDPPETTLLKHNSHTVDLDKQEPPETEETGLSLWAARGILLLVAAIWGTNFASVKYLNELCFHPPCNHPPSEFAFARFGLAALVSIPLLLKQRRDVILAGCECGLWITVGYVSQSMALATISSGECAFICSLTVVFVPIVSLILYGKPLKVKDLVAGVIAVSGVAVLEGMIDFREIMGIAPAMAAAQDAPALMTAAEPLADATKTLGLNPGNLLALGQPVGFGFAFTRIEHYQEQFKDVENRVLTIAASQCVMVGILSLFWVLYDYNGSIPNFEYLIEPHRLVTLAWTGIVTTLVAIYMEGIALQKASATDASIAFSSEPVWASLFGFLLLGERLSFNSYVGGSIIMAACFIDSLSDLLAKKGEHAEDLS